MEFEGFQGQMLILGIPLKLNDYLAKLFLCHGILPFAFIR